MGEKFRSAYIESIYLTLFPGPPMSFKLYKTSKCFHDRRCINTACAKWSRHVTSRHVELAIIFRKTFVW